MSDDKQLAALNAFSNALARASEEEIINTLCASVYPGAQRESVMMALAYCKAAGLDPLQKPVHLVPIWDGRLKQMRDVVMPGIGLYRTQAARNGNYGGIDEPEFGPDITETIGGVTITYPKWCKVTVYRIVNGEKVAFTAKEFWKENYAQKGGQDKSVAPNAMWTKRPYGQIAKCAEAQALRKAFPEVGSSPTAEEMEGKEFDVTPSEPARRVPDGVDTVTGEVLKKEPPAMPAYADADFSANWPKWVGLVDEGKQSWANIKKNLASKHSLTAEQIGYLDKPETFKQEPQA